jgi:hypothetical protein
MRMHTLASKKGPGEVFLWLKMQTVQRATANGKIR